MKKIFTPLNILFFIIFLSILIIKPYTNNLETKKSKKRFKLEKLFVVKKIIKRRGYFLFCEELKNREEFEIYPSNEMLNNINIGDTIHKLPNSNRCIIRNKNKEINVICYPDDMVDSSKE